MRHFSLLHPSEGVCVVIYGPAVSNVGSNFQLLLGAQLSVLP